MDLNEAEKKWSVLYQDWSEANQLAREARYELTQAFIKCAARQGPGPTTEQIERVERLEHDADEKRHTEAAFLRSVFPNRGQTP